MDKADGAVQADRPPLSPSVSGPCEHEDLLDGVIFGAKYLGSTQLVSERNPPPSTRMAQAQEAVDRVKVKPQTNRRVGGLGRPRPQGLVGQRLGLWGPPPPTAPPQAPDGETQPMTEVDLFISTKRVKVLMADSQVQGPGLASGTRRAPLRPRQPSQACSAPSPRRP